MDGADLERTRALLLLRRGLVFVDGPAGSPAANPARGVALEWSALGALPTARLQARLERTPLEPLAGLSAWVAARLSAQLGADRKHEPLFRRFPHDVPDDTRALWWKKVLVHFLQGVGPCLFCRAVDETHVLSPCEHVVCARCFDGSNYSACPVCEHHVDRSSPFFAPDPDARPLPQERVRFRLLDLGDDLEVEARRLLEGLCGRAQALSPVDRADLRALLADLGPRALDWLPAEIPVKEIAADAVAALLAACPLEPLLPLLRQRLRTATDVLRVLAAYSGADPALIGERIQVPIDPASGSQRWFGAAAERVAAAAAGAEGATVSQTVRRFRMAKLPRPLRRALLGLLEGLPLERLCEDVLRHRSYWVWAGEFLHPHVYARRFPNVAHAFRLVRRQDPDGTPAPDFHGFAGQVEGALASRDVPRAVSLLRARPGELARRLDHLLRLAGSSPGDRAAVLEAFATLAPQVSTPVLLALAAHLPARGAHQPRRVYWPKAALGRGVFGPDRRVSLSPDVIAPAVAAVEGELLARFARLPRFERALVDRALAAVPAPFNERSQSPGAIDLPRGARLAIPAGKLLRLFLHWCQPEEGGYPTDLDLSVGFYDGAWSPCGVCSYYELRCETDAGLLAQSAGDLRDAPHPDGATELVDVHLDVARAAGARYAVMVVNAYAGMAFSELALAFAGLMVRDDPEGAHFDPRTVALRFALRGENGVFLPLVLDLEARTLHWLDVYAEGGLRFNNVATSNRDIQRLCPALMAYFGSGVRLSLFDLALLHAAARADEVLLRGDDVRRVARAPGEDASAFLRRLRGAAAEHPVGDLPHPDGAPTFAALLRGDVDLPAGSTSFVLLPERVTGTIRAGELIP